MNLLVGVIQVVHGIWDWHHYVRKNILSWVVKLKKDAWRLPIRKLLYYRLLLNLLVVSNLLFPPRFSLITMPMWFMLVMPISISFPPFRRRAEISSFVTFFLFLAWTITRSASSALLPLFSHIIIEQGIVPRGRQIWSKQSYNKYIKIKEGQLTLGLLSRHHERPFHQIPYKERITYWWQANSYSSPYK